MNTSAPVPVAPVRQVSDSAGSPTGSRGRTTAAVLALARAESVRMLRHPAVLAAVAGIVLPWIYRAATGDAGNRFPVLQVESRLVQLPMLLLAVGTALAVNLACLRSSRQGVDALYEILVLPRWGRATAHLLSTVPLALLAAALSGARMAYLGTRTGAAGSVQVWELLAVPALVLLGGAVGVLTAQVTKSVVAAPLVVAVLGILTLAALVNNTSPSRWLSPVAYENEFAAPLPSDLIWRPAEWHLLWLLALTAILVVAALLLAGARSRLLGTGAALVALAVAAGVMQMRAMPVEVNEKLTRATERPAASQECRTVGKVGYCAFPEFGGRVTQWSEVVRGELRHVPAAVASSPYAVRQRIFPAGNGTGAAVVPPEGSWAADDKEAGTPGAVTVGTDWAQGGHGTDIANNEVITFAGVFAHRLVTGGRLEEGKATPVCGARAVVTLWLAAQATEGTEGAFFSLVDRTYGGGVQLSILGSASGLMFDAPEQDVAVELLDRPAGEVGTLVREGWAELTAEGTSVERAAELFGVTAPKINPAERGLC
ncbi:ABC transporter permease [Streptomyces sp. NPDC055749]